MENSVTVSVGVTRPIRLPACSVNHGLPSEPLVIPRRPLPAVIPLENCVTVPLGVMRPIVSTNSANHRLPSGPLVIPCGPLTGVIPAENSVMVPLGSWVTVNARNTGGQGRGRRLDVRRTTSSRARAREPGYGDREPHAGKWALIWRCGASRSRRCLRHGRAVRATASARRERCGQGACEWRGEDVLTVQPIHESKN
jgi:hypothetical protein